MEQEKEKSSGDGCELPKYLVEVVTGEQAQWDAVRSYCDLIVRIAKENGLDPTLVASLIFVESKGDANAFNKKSFATGLMQVMPRESKIMCLYGLCFADRPSSNSLLDPEFNIECGSNILATKIKENNNNIRWGLRLYGQKDIGFDYADDVLNIQSRLY